MGKEFFGCNFSEEYGVSCKCPECLEAEKKTIEYEVNRGWYGYIDFNNIPMMPEVVHDTTLLHFMLTRYSTTFLQNNKHIIMNIICSFPNMINDDFICVGINKTYPPITYGVLHDMNWFVGLLLNYQSTQIHDSLLLKICVNPAFNIGTIYKLISHCNFSNTMLQYRESEYENACLGILQNKDKFFEHNTYQSKKCSETRRKKIINILTNKREIVRKPHRQHQS